MTWPEPFKVKSFYILKVFPVKRTSTQTKCGRSLQHQTLDDRHQLPDDGVVSCCSSKNKKRAYRVQFHCQGGTSRLHSALRPYPQINGQRQRERDDGRLIPPRSHFRLNTHLSPPSVTRASQVHGRNESIIVRHYTDEHTRAPEKNPQNRQVQDGRKKTRKKFRKKQI